MLNPSHCTDIEFGEVFEIVELPVARILVRAKFECYWQRRSLSLYRKVVCSLVVKLILRREPDNLTIVFVTAENLVVRLGIDGIESVLQKLLFRRLQLLVHNDASGRNDLFCVRSPRLQFLVTLVVGSSLSLVEKDSLNLILGILCANDGRYQVSIVPLEHWKFYLVVVIFTLYLLDVKAEVTLWCASHNLLWLFTC